MALAKSALPSARNSSPSAPLAFDPASEDLVLVGDEARQVVAVAAGGERARHADQDHAPALEHVVGGARDRALGADHPEGGLGQVVADLDHRGSLVVARWDGTREQRA